MPKLPLTHANIINLLGIESLPLDERKEILMTAVELVETRTFNRVMERLPDNTKEELTKLLEAEDADAMADFLGRYNMDLVGITEEEVEQVKQELLKTSKE